jgi:hypothetical protein
VLNDGAASFIEQGAYELLRQPYRLVLDAHLNAILTRLADKNQELGGANR